MTVTQSLRFSDRLGLVQKRGDEASRARSPPSTSPALLYRRNDSRLATRSEHLCSPPEIVSLNCRVGKRSLFTESSLSGCLRAVVPSIRLADGHGRSNQLPCREMIKACRKLSRPATAPSTILFLRDPSSEFDGRASRTSSHRFPTDPLLAEKCDRNHDLSHPRRPHDVRPLPGARPTGHHRSPHHRRLADGMSPYGRSSTQSTAPLSV